MSTTIALTENGTGEFWLALTENGAPFDLSGCTLRMEGRRPGDALNAPTLALAAPDANGQGVVVEGDPLSGVVFGRITHTTLAAIPDSTGYFEMAFDLRVITPDGRRVVFGPGVITVSQGVTSQ